MNALDRFSRDAGELIERRRFLRRVAAWSAGIGTALIIPGVLRAADGSSGSPNPTSVAPANAPALPTACSIYCYIYDCCAGNCCQTAYPKLYRCRNNCDGTYFYACGPSNCQGFCYSYNVC